ncbi:pentatricopeptide repeat-containing protein At4g02750 [Beta vulgaris subsp. vulgaris]|uniref:pentatricopeptide repeat-containing protein At4g02750 n=1 Tax=Beta vulgaris subsp. vulgaris TaxID=3555 RepID=UPI000901E497|nr:pentatricopeptide repeat-containing protein At4g02750 [Beta vulgaris subsp. vulgaris]
MATRISYSTIVYLNNKEIYSAPFIQDYYENREHNLPKYEDTVLLTKRILNLSLRRKIDAAKKIFDGMLYKDIVAWNAMIRGFMENHMINHARQLFDEMPERNNVSWNTMIIGYSRENMIHIALKLFICMPCKDAFSWTAIITGLCMGSRISDAWRLFKEMPERNAVSWAAVMSGFQHNGLAAESLSLFKEMLTAGVVPNSHSFTTALAASADLAMLSMSKQLYLQLLKRGYEGNSHIGNAVLSTFMKCGSSDDAMCVFEDLPHRNLVSWNCMIAGYAQHGNGLRAIRTFHQMQYNHVSPDRITFLGVLQSCCFCGFVKEGKEYFQIMEKDYGIIPGPEHYACLTDLFARAGLLEDAYQVVMEMPFEPAIVFWRSIMNGCRIWRRYELGAYAAHQLSRLESTESRPSSEVVNGHGSCRLDAVSFSRRETKGPGTRKEMGCSWVEIKGRTYLFTSRDETHLDTCDIYQMINLLFHDILNHNRVCIYGPIYNEY